MGQISWHDFLIFSHHTDYFTKREPLWSILMFLYSLNMKTIELTFSELVKNHTVKDRTTLSLDSLNIGERTCRRRVIPSICYPPQNLLKNKRGTVNHDGENEGNGLNLRQNVFLNGNCQLSPLNMALVCIDSVNWGIHLSLKSLP